MNKSGSILFARSTLLVACRTRDFAYTSKDVLVKSRISVTLGGLIIFWVLSTQIKRVCLCLLNNRQWREKRKVISTSRPKELMAIWLILFYQLLDRLTTDVGSCWGKRLAHRILIFVSHFSFNKRRSAGAS